VFQLATRAQRMRRALALATIAALVLVIAGGAVALIRIQRAELSAVQQAAVARDEAERVRAAGALIEEKLELVRREQDAKARAEDEVRRGRQDLREVNGELRAALEQAHSESRRAQRLTQTAQGMAASLQTANQRLERLLVDERARAERLDRERKKIASELIR
jgi:hypothetical protein